MRYRKWLLVVGLLIGPAHGQMTPEQEASFQDRLTRWVKATYPELIDARGLSDRTVVAFVVDSKDRVLGQTRGLQPPYEKPTPLVDEVRRMLPKWKDAQFTDHGGACFGNPKNGSKYCVIYGQVAK